MKARKLDTSIRVNEETKKKLYRVKGIIEADKGSYTSMDDVINDLIKGYKKRKK